MLQLCVCLNVGLGIMAGTTLGASYSDSSPKLMYVADLVHLHGQTPYC